MSSLRSETGPMEILCARLNHINLPLMSKLQQQ